MRTFEHREGTSHKFWNIEVRDNLHIVSFGKVGGKGQTQRKQFPDAASAQAAADKLIREKLAKGYRETTTAAAPAGAAPSLVQALEAAIIEHPEETANYAAYADYLQEQGDPRGEFIQVQLALEDPELAAKQRKQFREREAALLREHQSDWVGDWVNFLDPEFGPEGRGQEKFTTPVFGFDRGVLAVVTIPELSLECARAFVGSSQTRLVRELRIGGWAFEDPDEEPSAADPPTLSDSPSQQVLLRWPYFSNLRVFQIGWASIEDYGDFCTHQCHDAAELAPDFAARMPRLEELYLFTHGVPGGKLFALPLPNLRILQVYHSHEYPLTTLAANPTLTNLTHLLCHPHALEYGSPPFIRLADLRAVVNSPHLTSLKHLRLRLTDFGDAGCEEIVKSGILRRLETLDLRHGCISDAGAELLAACPDLKRLKHLDLSRNELTAEGIRVLAAVGIPLRAEHQHGPTGADDGDREYLFEGDYE
jgi:uncharacterized protein (TIGR02996 family)